MFIEGNEISRLQRRKVATDELILFSLPENTINFNRTLMLLQKTNKTQRLAALQSSNLIPLARENPKQFCSEILPMLQVDINVNKDEDQIRQTAESLDLIADLKLLSS